MFDLGFYKNKKIAIPGGAGFVGAHLAEILRPVVAELFIPRVEDGIDFRRYEDCVSYFATTKPDIVINCAADQGGIGYYKGRQADVFLNNIQMNLYLLKAAQEAGVKKFVNVVPNCSYPGYAHTDVLEEEHYWDGEVHDSIFSYGLPRKVSVAFGKALFQQFGFSSIHVVAANMYGPGDRFDAQNSKALAAFIRKFYEAKRDGAPAVHVWGTGKPLRDWLYVKDGAEGILRAAAVYDDIEPLNIATGVGISVADLAMKIKEAVGYQGEIIFDTDKPDGAMVKISGVKKMKKVLGWVPATPLEAGIRETLEWFDKNYDKAISN
ncbi:MAG: NAD-dependent epimerase/dehydratase family protein [Candidatus Liptonbacteria bacterium]|nr:NAD-dependent epimerase/dehydratase family protein [Candidatus Liptonbacteria bacterium]